MFPVHGATSRTSEYLSQQLTTEQNESPLYFRHTILALWYKKLLSMKVDAKKMLPRNMPTHDSTNNMQSTLDARRPHTNKTLQCTQ